MSTIYGKTGFHKEMLTGPYTAFIELVSPLLTATEVPFLHSIPDLSLTFRKAYLTLCRCRSFVQPTSPLGLRLVRVLKLSRFLDFQHYVANDFVRSLTYQCLIAAPIEVETLRLFESQAFNKENEACTSPCVHTTIDWTVLWNQHHSLQNFVDDMPVSRNSITYVRGCINSWANKLQQRVFYPRLSPRKVTPHTAQLASLMDLTITTYIGLFAHYIETGQMVQGDAEVGIRHYPSILGPRVYYNQGGTCYWKTLFGGSMTTLLLEYFPNTARQTRVLPERLQCGPEDYAEFYDLVSFTSKTSEGIRVLAAVRQLVIEVEVRVFDAHKNEIKTVLLADVLADLLSANENVAHRLGERQFTSLQNGLLGVPSNIQICTLAHGLLIGLLWGFDRTNCAGDDGAIVLPRTPTRDLDSPHQVRSVLRNLGILQEEKVSSTWDGCGEHLKRSFSQTPSGLYREELYFIPSPEYQVRSSNRDTLRYPIFRQQTARSVKKSIASGLVGLAQQLHAHPSLDAGAYAKYARIMYDFIGFPHEGNVPAFCSVDTPGHPFVIPLEWWNDQTLEPVSYSCRNLYQGTVQIQEYWKVSPVFTDPRELSSNSRFLTNHTPSLNILSKCGYLHYSKKIVTKNGPFEWLLKVRLPSDIVMIESPDEPIEKDEEEVDLDISHAEGFDSILPYSDTRLDRDDLQLLELQQVVGRRSAYESGVLVTTADLPTVYRDDLSKLLGRLSLSDTDDESSS